MCVHVGVGVYVNVCVGVYMCVWVSVCVYVLIHGDTHWVKNEAFPVAKVTSTVLRLFQTNR